MVVFGVVSLLFKVGFERLVFLFPLFHFSQLAELQPEPGLEKIDDHGSNTAGFISCRDLSRRIDRCLSLLRVSHRSLNASQIQINFDRRQLRPSQNEFYTIINQIKRGGPVTVTDNQMTRFIMTISAAARLVIEACTLAKGGEVFISKMPVIRIIDLAEVMIELLAPRFNHAPEDIKIEHIGAKAGEKMYEELLNSEEILRSKELENHFVTLPAFRFMFENVDYYYPGEISDHVDRPYISSGEPLMSKEKLKAYLVDHKVFEHLEE